MKKILIAIVLLMAGNLSYAQQLTEKPIIDTSVFSKWPEVGSPSLTNNGSYAAFVINHLPVNSRTLVIRSTSSNWKTEFAGGEGKFTSDSRYAVIDLPGDSLCICKLGTDQKEYIDHAGSYSLSKYNNEDWLAYQINDPEMELVLRNLATGKQQQYKSVSNFVFSGNGNTILLQTEEKRDSSITHKLVLLDMQGGKLTTIWKGENSIEGYTFSSSGNDLAFFVSSAQDGESVSDLWNYRKGETTAKLLVGQHSEGIGQNLGVSPDDLIFSRDGNRIFFKLVEQHLLQAKPEAVKVDIWNYKDEELQSEQLDLIGPRKYFAVVNINDGKLTRLQQDSDRVYSIDMEIQDDVIIMMKSKASRVYSGPWWVNKNANLPLYLVDTKTGFAKLVKDHVSGCVGPAHFQVSPDSRWVVYFDYDKQAYCSFDRENGITRNLTKNTMVTWVGNELFGTSTSRTPGLMGPFLFPVGSGLAGWRDDGTVLVYDEYDIWRLDPSGTRPPVNVTNGYGRKNHIRFRFVDEDLGASIIFAAPGRSKWILRAFDTESKYNGLYKISQDGKRDPEKLVMGPWSIGYTIVKAKNDTTWIVQRESATEAPNYYITHNLKTYTSLSDLQPQKGYNWLTAELHHWRTPDGIIAAGILYKPENFDPHKKYPVLFNYYEKRSGELCHFQDPEATADNINIPYFVSRGYLVFVPDIHYKIGYTAKSTVDCVTSAAKYIATLPYVDGKKMGIEGISHGGYETNVLVTHTHLFAAACTGAGASDLVSEYNGLSFGLQRFHGISGNYYYEANQGRIGATLWQRPDLYIMNSPICQADQVTTPLLIFHGEQDRAVHFEQGIEFYTSLHRLGKKVWMLQYNEDGHGMTNSKDAMDLTIRMTQFFDHYLKAAPPPKWMTEGVPARLKGIENGLELDASGKQP